MGNGGSSGSGRRRHRSHPAPENPQPAPQPQPPLPDGTANRFVFAAATPYPTQYANAPPFFHYPGYYPPPPVPPVYPHQFRMGGEVFPGGYMAGGWGGAVRPHPGGGSGAPLPGEPYVDHQKAVTIRNDVNVKKESLRIEPDEENPGSFLVAFTFDAIAPGSVSVMFFAKEDVDCNVIVTKENVPKAVTVPFEQGLGQKFRQPSGTGIDFSKFDETELTKGNDSEFYPLVVKAEACALNNGESENEKNGTSSGNTQITQAVFGKEKGKFHVRVMKQILWVNKMRYELQEIFGIGNSIDDDFDGNESGKECVICLSEPRDTAVLPCRHMCMCSGCAKLLRFQTDQCPICRQLVERLLEIKVNNTADD